MKKLNQYFDSSIEIPRIRFGKRKTLVTLINEEALLFVKHLRESQEKWTPRIITFKI